MKSTPTNSLLAESYEIALPYRRKILASKFLSNYIGVLQHPLIEFLTNLRKQYLKNPTNQRIPMLVQAYEPFLPYLKKVFLHTKHPCYEITTNKHIKKVKNLNLLPNELKICNAEVAAIHEAVIVIITKTLENTIIFSDSSSAIRKINRAEVSTGSDFSTLRTRNFLIEANKVGCNILLTWIPRHAGIQCNVVVDTLANIGRNFNIAKKKSR